MQQGNGLCLNSASRCREGSDGSAGSSPPTTGKQELGHTGQINPLQPQSQCERQQSLAMEEQLKFLEYWFQQGGHILLDPKNF